MIILAFRKNIKFVNIAEITKKYLGIVWRMEQAT